KNHLSRFWKPLIVVLLLTGTVVVLLPLVIVFLASLVPTEATTGTSLLPKASTLANYHQAWQHGNFLLAFANLNFVALVVT
ncbi:MAG TPA: carbohydrate ABC transporter permease, partial [Leptolyngbyaceae cyanobacterium]